MVLRTLRLQRKSDQEVEATRISKNRRLKQAYDVTFGGPDGKLVLQDLATSFGLLSIPNPETSDHVRAFQDGQRSVMMKIFHVLAMRIEDVQHMIEEQQDEEIFYERDPSEPE